MFQQTLSIQNNIRQLDVSHVEHSGENVHEITDLVRYLDVGRLRYS